MDQTERDVKEMILDVAGLNHDPENLEDDTTLDDLAFSDPMCGALAVKLRTYLEENNGTGTIHNAEIDADLTAGEVVALVKTKLP